MSAGISIIFHRFVALELRMCHDLEPRSLVKGQNAHSGFTTVWAMTGVYCYVCVALVTIIATPLTVVDNLLPNIWHLEVSYGPTLMSKFSSGLPRRGRILWKMRCSE